jgi:phosphatidylinositol alpha-1,6-mannosyltransferase
VIAGNSGGAPEAIVDGETGYVVSRKILKSRVLELIGDPTLRKSMGEAGRNRVIADFQINQRGEQLRSLLG